MVEKIPVGAPNVADIGTHGDNPAAALQTAQGLGHGARQSCLGQQMLKEVTSENNIEATVGKAPWQGAVLFQEFHSGIKFTPGNRIQIHRIFSFANNVVDKLAVSTAEIQYCGIGRNKFLKPTLDQCFPYFVPVFLVSVKPMAVDCL